MKRQPTNSGSCVGTPTTKEPVTSTSPVRITLPCAEIEITPLREPSEKGNACPYLKESEPMIESDNVAITKPDSETSQLSVDIQELNNPDYTKALTERKYQAIQLFGALFSFYVFYVSERTLRLSSMVSLDDFLLLPLFLFSIPILFVGIAVLPSIFLHPFVKKEGSEPPLKMNRVQKGIVCFYFTIYYVAFPILLYVTYIYQLGPIIFIAGTTILALPLVLPFFF